MANVTDAIGTFTFNSDFYKENQDLIDAYFHNAKLGMNYGIFSLVNNHDGSFNFEANGRWSMQNTLKWCLTPLDSESQPIFDELFNKLRNRNQIIMFDYNDYDPAMGWREHQMVAISPALQPKPKENYFFDINSETTEDLPTDEFSLIDDNVEDGINIKDANDTAYPIIHSIIIKLVTYLNNDKAKQDYKIKDVEDKFFDYINHDPHYRGGFLEEHYDNNDNLKDWYDEEFSKLFK